MPGDCGGLKNAPISFRGMPSLLRQLMVKNTSKLAFAVITVATVIGIGRFKQPDLIVMDQCALVCAAETCKISGFYAWIIEFLHKYTIPP